MAPRILSHPLSSNSIRMGEIPDACYFWMERRFSWAKYSALSALFVLALSLAVALPDFRDLVNWHPGWVDQALEWKLRHPLSAIPVEQFAFAVRDNPEMAGVVSHIRKHTYRVTFPVIAYCLGLDLRQTYVLSLLASVAFPVVILLHFRKTIPKHPLIALLLAVSIACSFIGQWGVHRWEFFDGAAYLLLAVAAYSEWPPLIAVSLIAGGLCDERVILAAPLIYLLQSRASVAKLKLQLLVKPDIRQYGVLVGVAVFVVIRVLLGLHIGRQFDGAGVGFAQLQANAILLPLAGLLAFKGAAYILAAGLRFYSGFAALMLLACALPGIIGSLLVWDLCRSLGYTFPVLLLCVQGLLEADSQTVRTVAICGAFISASVPTYYLWGTSIMHLPLVLRLFTHG